MVLLLSVATDMHTGAGARESMTGEKQLSRCHFRDGASHVESRNTAHPAHDSIYKLIDGLRGVFLCIARTDDDEKVPCVTAKLCPRCLTQSVKYAGNGLCFGKSGNVYLKE